MFSILSSKASSAFEAEAFYLLFQWGLLGFLNIEQSRMFYMFLIMCRVYDIETNLFCILMNFR